MEYPTSISQLKQFEPDKTAILLQLFKSTTNSYKLFWFLSILSQIEKDKGPIIPVKNILVGMVVNAWHPVCYYNLSLGVQDKLQKVLRDMRDSENIPATSKASDIRKKINEVPRLLESIEQFNRYVPTRFISPFFKTQLVGMKDSLKDRFIIKEALGTKDSSKAAIYYLEDHNDSIVIADTWYEFLQDNLGLILEYARFQLVRYLQSKNANVPGIVNKLEAPSKRNLSYAHEKFNKARQIFKESNRSEKFIDIYSGKPISGSFSIDHFLPWSYVAHDQIWNLVPTEAETNSSKSNILPSIDYIRELAKLHQLFIKTLHSPQSSFIDTYSEVLHLSASELLSLPEESFIKEYRNIIEPQMVIAERLGSTRTGK